MSSMSKIRVLLGGILPVNKQIMQKKNRFVMMENRKKGRSDATDPLLIYCYTFSFLAIRQRWRDGQFSALSCAHVLQTFIPTLEHFFDPKSEPYWISIPILAAAKSHKDPSQFSLIKESPVHTDLIPQIQ